MNLTMLQYLDNFMRRDREAVEEYQNGVQCIESALHFTTGRLTDVTALVVILMRREIERDAAADSKEEEPL